MANWTTPITANVGDVYTASWYNQQTRDNLTYLYDRWATGDFKYSGQDADHGPWLVCTAGGRNVLRATYADLFDLYNAYSPSLPYGTGDGSTTFGLPDPGGRILVVKGAHADVNAYGDSDGVASANRSPKHNSSVTDPQHAHSIPAGSGSGSNKAEDDGRAVSTTGSTGSSPTGITVGPGGTLPVDTPAYLVAGNLFVHI